MSENLYVCMEIDHKKEKIIVVVFVAGANYGQFSFFAKKNFSSKLEQLHEGMERWKLNLPHVCLLPRNHLKSRYATKKGLLKGKVA